MRRDGSPTRRPTLRDVAEASGVSIGTVSGVLNERENARVPDKTQDRLVTVDLDPPLSALEIVIDGGSPDVHDIEFVGSDDSRMRIPIRDIPADVNAPDGQSTTVYFDTGIVEAFRDGRAATTTHFALDRVARVVIERSARCTAHRIEVWPLTG